MVILFILVITDKWVIWKLYVNKVKELILFEDEKETFGKKRLNLKASRRSNRQPLKTVQISRIPSHCRLTQILWRKIYPWFISTWKCRPGQKTLLCRQPLKNHFEKNSKNAKTKRFPAQIKETFTKKKLIPHSQSHLQNSSTSKKRIKICH